MLCENCGKKDATSIFLPPNETKLKYLCGACYKTINNGALLEEFAKQQATKIKIDATCTNCGTRFSDFQQTCRFGCENCYNTFGEHIRNNFLPMFSEQKFLGKKPNIFYVKQEIKNLEQIIEICFKNKDYARATKYGKELEKLKEQAYGKL